MPSLTWTTVAGYRSGTRPSWFPVTRPQPSTSTMPTLSWRRDVSWTSGPLFRAGPGISAWGGPDIVLCGGRQNPGGVGRHIAELAHHLLGAHKRMVEHALAGPDLDIGVRVGGPVAALRCGKESGEVVVVPIRVAEEEGASHRAAVAPSDLELDERLAGHGHQCDLPVDEDRAHVEGERSRARVPVKHV